MNKDKRTYKDRRDYFIKAVAKRRKEIRLRAIDYKGGKCKKCGYKKYPEVLEFHHKDPSSKDFNISQKGHCRSWKKVKDEIEKCELFCANCHREIHVEQKKLAALKGNFKMKKQVNSGNPERNNEGNPEPSSKEKVQRLDTCYLKHMQR